MTNPISAREAAPRPVAARAPLALSIDRLLTLDPASAVLALILGGTLVRLALAATLGLGTDESYTVANARTLALSYVDYPPLHAWIVAAWSWLLQSDAPFVVRLPFIACFAAATWLMFTLTRGLFGARAGVWAALLFNIAPVFTLAHASWVVPDGPLIVLMLAAAGVVARLLFAQPAPSGSVAGWMLAGGLAGLAALTKYHGLFVPAAVFLVLVTWAPGRRLLAGPGPWLGALVTAAVFAPVIVWNAGHDWAGLSFQTDRLARVEPSVLRLLGSLGGQAGYLSPWLFVPLAAVWLAALARGPRDGRRWFLALLASGPILFFTGATIVAKGLPHWPMPGWLFAVPLLGAAVAGLDERWLRRVRPAVAGVLAVLAVLCVAVGAEGASGWLQRVLPPPLAAADPTLDLVDWREVATALDERGLLHGVAAVAGVRWKEAGKLNYALGPAVPVLCLCPDPQQFRYLDDPRRFAGETILVVGAHRSVRKPDASLTRWFDRVERLAPVTLHRGGVPALELAVVRGVGFRPDATASAAEAEPRGEGRASRVEVNP